MDINFLTQLATQDGAQYAWLRQRQYRPLPFFLCAPVGIITRKQALSAIDTLNRTLPILEKAHEHN
jgi:hypothetical protein